MAKKCGAKTRRGGKCQHLAMPNGKCRFHGGKTPKGPAHPAFKHGRYSKDLPSRMSARFADAVTDGELIQLERDVALVDTRVGELLSELSQDSAGVLFQRIQKAWDRFKNGSPDEQAKSTLELTNLIEQGANDWLKWQEIYDLIERRRRLVESEFKRQAQLNQVLTVSEGVTLITAFVDIVKQHVSDAATLKGISKAITGLLDNSGGATAKS